MSKITEQDLIDNLIKQITDHKKENAPDSKVTLNISNCEIDFEFNFEDILKGLGITEVQAIQPYAGRKSKMECSYNIEFSNCIFNQNVILRNTAFSQNVILNDIVFNQGVNFSYTDFNQVVDFTRVIFEKNVIVEDTNFNGYTLFESVEFKTFENPDDKNNKRILKNVNFKEITCCNSYMRNIAFEKCNFEELNVYKVGVDINLFLYPTEWDTVNFTHCEFKKLLLGKSIIRDCLFNKSTIIEEADFHTHLCPADINKVRETRTIIDNTKFSKVHFKQSADFKDSIIKSSEWFAIKFDKDADFKRVDFGDTVSFHHVYFGDIGAFWNIKGKYIQFDSIHLVEKSNIYFGYINQNKLEDNKTWKIIEDHKNSKLDFTNTMIKGIVNFNTGNNIEKINFKGSQVNDNLSLELCPEKCENWETACILKDEELKRNNTIKALEYHAEEKEHYMKELWDNKKIIDLISLMLSKIVNNHGQNWFQALCFTLSIPIFSYTLFSLSNNLFWNIVLWELGLVVVVSFIAFFKPISKLSKKINLKTTSTLGKNLIILYNLLFNTQTLLCAFYLSSIGILFYFGMNPVDLGTHLGELIDYFVPTNYISLKSYVKEISYRGNILTISGGFVYIIGKIALPYGIYEVYKAFRKYR